jgi:hypothetical protein
MTEQNDKTNEAKPVEATSEAAVEVNPLVQAEALAARLEAANKKQEELVKRQEDLMARAMLSGKSLAGEAPKPKEETPKEYAARVLKGQFK